MRRLCTTRAARGDDGIILIFIALLMVAMLLVVAMVIDLSVVRNTRQSNKSTADFAVAAGLQGLNNPSGIPQPWQGVCESIAYLQGNKAGMSGLTSSGTYTDGNGAVLTNPCANTNGAAYQTVCSTWDHSTWAVFNGTANGVSVTIKSGYVLPDPAFAEDGASGAYANSDLGAATEAGCDQLAVIIRQTDPATFGTVDGKTGYPTATRSVGRLTINEVKGDIISLLLLEQTSCGTLTTSGNNTLVHVRNASNATPPNLSKPGFIHSNSDASDTSSCTGSARVLEGSIYNPTGGPSIIADDSADGTVKGQISDPAVGGSRGGFSNTPSCATPTSGCTIAPDPIWGHKIGRGLVDDRYLGLGPTPTRVTALKTEASNLYNATSAPTGFTTSNNCSGNGSISSATGKVYLNCTLQPGPNQTISFDTNITDVVVHGNVDAKGILNVPNVRRFYVSGTVSVSGELHVNNHGATSCGAGTAAAAGQVTRFAIGHDFTATAANTTIQLCNTFVYLGVENPLPTTRDTAPLTNTNYVGTLNMTSSTHVEWTAPNQSVNQLADGNSDPLYDDFEDLALWTEYSGNCQNSGPQLGGQGQIVATGIFFLPNACPFGIAGGGNGASIDSDAQFIARRLRLTGTVSLVMAPNPADAIAFPVINGFTLVR